jgi:hypothetical protein
MAPPHAQSRSSPLQAGPRRGTNRRRLPDMRAGATLHTPADADLGAGTAARLSRLLCPSRRRSHSPKTTRPWNAFRGGPAIPSPEILQRLPARPRGEQPRLDGGSPGRIRTCSQAPPTSRPRRWAGDRRRQAGGPFDGPSGSRPPSYPGYHRATVACALVYERAPFVDATTKAVRCLTALWLTQAHKSSICATRSPPETAPIAVH